MNTDLRDRIIQHLKDNGKTYLLDLYDDFPEINGKFSIFMPTKENYNNNVLWMPLVTSEFIDVFSELIKNNKYIFWEPTDIMELMFDAKGIVSGVPLVTKKLFKKSQKQCWMPISIWLRGDLNKLTERYQDE